MNYRILEQLLTYTKLFVKSDGKQFLTNFVTEKQKQKLGGKIVSLL